MLNMLPGLKKQTRLNLIIQKSKVCVQTVKYPRTFCLITESDYLFLDQITLFDFWLPCFYGADSSKIFKKYMARKKKITIYWSA